MNKYAEMRTRQQKEFDSLPLGFAFSDKQFAEVMQGWGLDPEKDLDKICSIGYGGFVQKKDAKLLHTTTARHEEELSAAIAADQTGDGFICDMFRYESVIFVMDVVNMLSWIDYVQISLISICAVILCLWSSIDHPLDRPG